MRHAVIPLLFLFLASACLSAAPAASTTSEALATLTSVPGAQSTAVSPMPTTLGLQALTAYRATFELRFRGTYSWTYWLESRVDGHKMAYDLRIEGVEPPQNPGDVRVVLEGDVARMRGPATEDACVQFPGDYDLGRSFLSPDELIPSQELEAALRQQDTAIFVGREATLFTAQQSQLAGWRDAEVAVWKDDATGAVLRYELRLTGLDPLFDAGEGVLSGQFVVDEIGPQTIKPISGCEVDLPLPPDATRLVSMPGLIAFDSVSSTEEIVTFYETALPKAGWESTSEPETGIDAVLLSYRRREQTLNINIEADEEGVHVELLLSDE
jgi:hypothetical protein